MSFSWLYTRKLQASVSPLSSATEARGEIVLTPVLCKGKIMENIKIYEISSDYIDYLVPIAEHLYHNKKNNQKNERKYIGIVLTINGYDYFAPLSSFKPKHLKMKESIDFIKVKDYAVINLNNMFPVPIRECRYVDIKNVKDPNYRALLLAEYRYIKSIQGKIRKNALTVYRHKIKNADATPLAKRCNDFAALEKACMLYL